MHHLAIAAAATALAIGAGSGAVATMSDTPANLPVEMSNPMVGGAAMLPGEAVSIYGDGETSRDFCYVDNVVQANLLAATVDDAAALGQAYNVAVGERMTLNELYAVLRDVVVRRHPGLDVPPPRYFDFRAGDVRHSEADIGKARRLLGYVPGWSAKDGLVAALPWYEALLAPSIEVVDAPSRRMRSA